MSPHDEWARLTPYEVGIPGRVYAERVFERITEEAETRSADAADPGAFALLGQVGLAIREIQGEERGGEALQRYGAFLFHAFHLRRAGETVLLLETGAARRLVASPGDAFAAWDGALPAEAGYLQLPRNLFWSHSGEGEAESGAEPLDGIFWTRSSGDTLALLVALGVRADRPGISVVELPPVPIGEVRASAGRTVREEGMDFETTLPGGEMDELYSIVTIGEALKLVARAFAYVVASPEALGAVERAPRSADVPTDPGVPRPSLLPFRRVR